MNIKECIKFLEKMKMRNLFYWDEKKIALKENEDIDEIIKRMKMWEDFKEKYRYHSVGKVNKEGLMELTTDSMFIEFIMDEFEKKYLERDK